MRAVPSVFLLGCVASLAAQRTIVVDANRGAGFNFVDIPPAVAVAQDGDTILVRSGDYASVSLVNKAIALLGQPGARILTAAPFGSAAAVEIVRLGAGREVTVRGFRAEGAYGEVGEFVVEGCAGRVLLEDLDAQTDVSIANSNGVVMNRCTWGGTAWCRFALNVSMTSCVGRGDTAGGATMPGLGVLGGSVTCADCSFTGVPGLGGGLFFPGGPGIRLYGSTLQLAGGANNVVTGSPVNGGSSTPAILGDGQSTLEIDPDIVLVGYNGPAIANVTVQTSQLATLTVQTGSIGTVATVGLAGNPGELYVLFFALLGDPLPVPALGGDLWLDPATITLGATGMLGASGNTTSSYPTPNLPDLIGRAFAWQGATGLTTFRLTNPVGFTHLP
ncbi:MAG: hypothetical protein R3F56_08835 [Planctomycetota bacterium]